MEIAVKVTVDLSNRFAGLLERALSRSAEAATERNIAKITAPVNQPEPEPVEEAKSEAPAVKVPETPEAPEAETPETPAVAVPTDDEMKTLMDIAISKHTGTTGWKESADPKVQAIRKAMARIFKQVAKHLGAEKPTALKGEARAAFLEEIEKNIMFNTNEQIPEWHPF